MSYKFEIYIQSLVKNQLANILGDVSFLPKQWTRVDIPFYFVSASVNIGKINVIQSQNLK